MLKYAQLFADALTAEDIKFDCKDERAIRVAFGGENLQHIQVLVLFDKDNDPLAQLVGWEIASFKGKEEKGLQVCNELNARFRWVKFYLDDELDVRAEMDLRFTDESCGELCVEHTLGMISMIDSAYPTIGKALWA